ncbi:hypothetical protein ZIOFF_073040 [Zingiber officinale]|uniref:Legumain prodomain domain-containing protein n=1 Tax=Zingiber officinale TaxID=94328 RepID=A0A8J5CSD3_ZINOF|nr:hypothetical protein ZIOFF_073040 [Zingiber officinale]
MEYDDNRYNSSRGAHLNLKRAEKASILVNKNPALVDTLAGKTHAWEEDRGMLFMYESVPLLSECPLFIYPFVDLFMHVCFQYERLEEGSNKKKEILSEITEMMMHRAHLDSSIKLIGNLIFGSAVAPSVLKTVRPSGQALVDDWVCLKTVVQAFESHCGSLTQYGMKYMRAFANICNEGVSKDAMEEACGNVCGSYNSAKWSPFIHGYSA